ncbi:hypothetical protein AeMF1_008985 [Aphanomyces euteiches]|nr:hypothetical protein AeMF1_008985 [Aphanomyces euteiches]KAH9188566.1 hypothetical protein AeNC1_009455 [Aphanomyces euteiches]
MASEESWLQDLQILIATDDQLQDDLATVCDLFDSDDGFTTRVEESASTSSSSSSSSPIASPHRVADDDKIPKTTSNNTKDCPKEKVKPQRSSVRQREEIRCLRQQIDQLSKVLQTRQTIDLTTIDMPLWKRTAKMELLEKNKALQENEHLRDAISQQATFIEQMQSVFRKKPRLGTHIDVHSEEWQAYKLAAQASLRQVAIHAIADRQYNRMQSALVKAGVFDRENYLFQVKALPQRDQSYTLEIIHHVDLDAPFRLVGAAAWQVFDGDFQLDLPFGAVQSYTRIDPFTVYATYEHQSSGTAWHSNMIRKYFVEHDREVIVSRTVLEDAAIPHMTKGAIENRCMWLTVKPLPSEANRCRFTLLQHLVWPKDELAFEDADMDIVVGEIKQLCFGFMARRRGRLPMPIWMDISQLPHPKMGAFVERGRRFLRLLQATVNDVIGKFHGEQQIDTQALSSSSDPPLVCNQCG